MNKLSFQELEHYVDKLYDVPFDEDEVDKINKHCNYIISFIRSKGWTEEEYIRAMFGFSMEN